MQAMEEAPEGKPMTALQYKMNARHALTGRKFIGIMDKDREGAGVLSTPQDEVPPLAILSFRSEQYAVTEEQHLVMLMVTCKR